MAALPDKEKLLRNFLRCANWEEKYLIRAIRAKAATLS